jgi:hypothetical protein
MTDQMDQLLPETPEEIAVAAEPQDIDPGEWLTASEQVITGYVDTIAGRLKIAALTEEESEKIRKSAESINPANPRGPRIMSLMKMRLATVAASLNKAYGYAPSDPRYLTAAKMPKTLAGEVTMIVKKITELGGYTEEQGLGPDLFQVS